jgi:predicted Zn-dependent protease
MAYYEQQELSFCKTATRMEYSDRTPLRQGLEPLSRLAQLRSRGLVIVLLLLLAIDTAGCTLSRNPITGRKRALAWTWEQEKQIGAEADQQITAQFGLYENEFLAAYVERIGQRVLAESHVRRPDADPVFRETPFFFRVLDSPIVNAFALPGGYIYVTRGLISHLDNEAQLAVVLGHEIGHVEARHASQRALAQQLGQIGLIGGAILGQELLGLPAQDLLNIGGTAVQLMFLKYSRDDERESDQLGVEYAARADYEASEGSAFFESLKRIGEREGHAIPNFLSTHPDPGQREIRIREMADEWRQRTEMHLINQDAFYAAIDGMILGENPREGFVQSNVYYHPELAFRFGIPSGFQLINQRQQVVLLESNQRAIMVLTLSQQASARAAAAHLVGQQGIREVESGATTVSDLPAFYVVADAQPQQGPIVRLVSFFIEYGGNVYSFLGYSTRDDFPRYQDAFVRTIRGFSRLTDSSILNVQPVRVATVTADRTAPFSAFVPSRLPPDFSADDLAIVNQVHLNQQIPQGTALKLTR